MRPRPAAGRRNVLPNTSPASPGRSLLSEAVDRLKLSARAYHRVLRVARTLADLAGVEGVQRIHVAEALSFPRLSLKS